MLVSGNTTAFGSSTHATFLSYHEVKLPSSYSWKELLPSSCGGYLCEKLFLEVYFFLHGQFKLVLWLIMSAVKVNTTLVMKSEMV